MDRRCRIEVAAAKAGFSRATGYRIAADPPPAREKKPRGRRRPDPLADIFDSVVVPNGSIEGPHGHLKRRIADALALRGSSDFADLAAYRAFIADVVGRANAHRCKAIEAERATLHDLPVDRTADYEPVSVNITSSSGFVLRRVFYTVPSRLIGHRLGARVYDDRIELFLSGAHLLTLPRGRAGATGPNVHVVSYRHVIHSLKKKPMALKNLVYRDALFPREPYRRCFETALERLGDRQACRLAVTLLALAHEENCEAELAHAIDKALNAGHLPDPDKLKARFAPDPGSMPNRPPPRPGTSDWFIEPFPTFRPSAIIRRSRPGLDRSDRQCCRNPELDRPPPARHDHALANPGRAGQPVDYDRNLRNRSIVL